MCEGLCALCVIQCKFSPLLCDSISLFALQLNVCIPVKWLCDYVIMSSKSFIIQVEVVSEEETFPCVFRQVRLVVPVNFAWASEKVAAAVATIVSVTVYLLLACVCVCVCAYVYICMKLLWIDYSHAWRSTPLFCAQVWKKLRWFIKENFTFSL